MSGELTFVCDRCGALGSAPAAGRVRCGACGRIAVVEAPAVSSRRAASAKPASPARPTPVMGAGGRGRTGSMAGGSPPAGVAPQEAVSPAAPAPPVEASAPAEAPPVTATARPERASAPAAVRLPPLAPPSGPDRFERSEISPDELPPPEGGYEDLVLDDEGAAGVAPPPAAPAPPAAVAAPLVPPPLPPAVSGASRKTAPAPSPAAPEFTVPYPVAPRNIPRLVAAAVLFGAGAALAAGVTVAARAVLREPGVPAEAPAPADMAPAPAVQPPAAVVAVPDPPPDLAAAPAAEPEPSASAEPAPRRKESRRAEASVSISARRLVPAPSPVAGAGDEGSPEDAPPEPATHGLTAPRPIEVASAAPAPVVEDAPLYPGNGFRKPAPADRACVQRALRLPRDLSGRFDGTLTVKFPVAADGAVGRIEFLGEPPDPRLVQAVEAAVRACRFLPGADAQGNPTALWAVMPLRFVAR